MAYVLGVVAIVAAIVVVRPEEVAENLGRWGQLTVGVSRYLVLPVFPIAWWLVRSNRRLRRAMREEEARLATSSQQQRAMEEYIADFRAPLMGDTARAGGSDPVTLEPTVRQMDFAQARDGVRRLGAMVRQRFPDVELLVGLDSGGAILAGLLGKMLGKPVTCMTVGLPLPDGDPLVQLEKLKDRRILLLDDASRTGRTMEKALKLLDNEGRRPSKIMTGVLLYVPDRKAVGAKLGPDFHACVCENITLKMPWGTKT